MEASGRSQSTEAGLSTVWPILHYADTESALALFTAIGFDPHYVGRDEHGEIVHAELRWPGGGAFLFGSSRHLESVHAGLTAGACYVATDEVDEVHRRATSAGAEVLGEPEETAFGSGVRTRAFSLRDTEGNLWTFATYRGAPRA